MQIDILLKIMYKSFDFEERNRYKKEFTKELKCKSVQDDRNYWVEWQKKISDGDYKNLLKRKRWNNKLTGKHLSGNADNYFIEYREFLRGLNQFTIEKYSQCKPANLSFLNKDFILPFQELLSVVVVFARESLKERIKNSKTPHIPYFNFLSEDAYYSLERTLLENISNICKWVLLHEFTSFRPQSFYFLKALNIQKNNISDQHYKKFVKNHLLNGFSDLFCKYPALSRQLFNTVSFWVKNTGNFLNRLENDYIQLSKVFTDKKNQVAPLVISIANSLSDPHEGGKTVCCLTFNTGEKFIYKPRPLKIESAYFKTLEWYNKSCKEVMYPFKILKIISKKRYGWVEYVEHLQCNNEEEVKRFYYRAGMHLCVFYILKGNDLHYENIIACGEYPVIVDLETLFYPDVEPLKNSPTEIASASIVNNEYSDSVLRAGLLPFWQVRNDSNLVIDNSGLGAIPNQKISNRSPIIKNINSDEMHLDFEEKYISSIKSNVILKKKVVSVADYVTDLKNGFEHFYTFVLDNKSKMLSNKSILEKFKECQIRYIFRNTTIYNAFLYNLLLPESLTDGNKFRLEIEKLGRIFNVVNRKPKEWHVFQCEIEALKKLDYPRFVSKPDSRALFFEERCLQSNYFKKSSYSRVISQIKKMGVEDLIIQKNLITGIFYARYEGLKGISTNIKKNENIFSKKVYGKINYIKLATEIADSVIKNAYKNNKDNISWIGMSYFPHVEKYHYRPLSYNLYDGTCGIALFYAALFKVTNEIFYKNICLKSIAELRNIIRSYKIGELYYFVFENGIGGATGIGSMIYSLVKISGMINEPSLINEAKKLSGLITKKGVDKEKNYDIIGGCAGAILGLISLYNYDKSIQTYNKINFCSDHLVNNITAIGKDNIKAWKGIWEKPLTGFSHGASGIAFALCRSYSINKNQKYLDIANEGLQYERSVFSGKHFNWPDFTGQIAENEEKRYANTWCHGAPGIAMARLGILEVLNENTILNELKVGLKTAFSQELRSLDHICCGNFGLIEIGLKAGEKLKEKELNIQVNSLINKTIERSLIDGNYKLFIDLPSGNFNPGFFRGLSGIGYQYLRLAYPDKIPSVLLWE